MPSIKKALSGAFRSGVGRKKKQRGTASQVSSSKGDNSSFGEISSCNNSHSTNGSYPPSIHEGTEISSPPQALEYATTNNTRKNLHAHDKPPRHIGAAPLDTNTRNGFEYNARGAVPMNILTTNSKHVDNMHRKETAGEDEGSMESFRLRLEVAELKQRLMLLGEKDNRTNDSDTDDGRGITGETRSELLDLIKEREEEISELNNTVLALKSNLLEKTTNIESLEHHNRELESGIHALEKDKKRLSRHLNVREQEVVTLVKRLAGEDERMKEAVEIKARNIALSEEIAKLKEMVENDKDNGNVITELRNSLAAQERKNDMLQIRMEDLIAQNQRESSVSAAEINETKRKLLVERENRDKLNVQISKINLKNQQLEEELALMKTRQMQDDRVLQENRNLLSARDENIDKLERKIINLEELLEEKKIVAEQQHDTLLRQIREREEEARITLESKQMEFMSHPQNQVEYELSAMRQKLAFKDEAIGALEEKTLSQTKMIISLQSQLEDATIKGRQVLIDTQNINDKLKKENKSLQNTCSDQEKDLHILRTAVDEQKIRNEEMEREIASLSNRIREVTENSEARCITHNQILEGLRKDSEKAVARMQVALDEAMRDKDILKRHLDEASEQIRKLQIDFKTSFETHKTEIRRVIEVHQDELTAIKADATEKLKQEGNRVMQLSSTIQDMQNEIERLSISHEHELDFMNKNWEKERQEILSQKEALTQEMAFSLEERIAAIRLQAHEFENDKAANIAIHKKEKEEMQAIWNEREQELIRQIEAKENVLRTNITHLMNVENKSACLEEEIIVLKDKFEALEISSASCRKKIEELEEEKNEIITQHTGDIEHLKQVAKTVELDLTKKLESSEEMFKLARREADSLRAQVDAITSAFNKSEQAEATNILKIQSLEFQLESAKEDNETLKRSLSSDLEAATAHGQTIQSELDLMKSQLSQYSQTLEEVTSEKKKSDELLQLSNQHIRELEGTLAKRNADIQQVQRNLTDLTLKHDDLLASHAELTLTYKQNDEAATEMRQKLSEVIEHKDVEIQKFREQAQMQELQLKIEVENKKIIEEKLQENKDLIRSLKEAVVQKNTELQQLYGDLADLTSENKGLVSRIEQAKINKEQDEKAIIDVRREFSNLREEIHQKQKSIEGLVEALKLKEKELESLNGELSKDRLVSKEQALLNRSKIERAKKDRQKWEEMASKLQKENSELSTQLETERNEINRQQSMMVEMKDTIQQLEMDGAELVADLESQMELLKRDNDNLSEEFKKIHTQQVNYTKEMNEKLLFALAERDTIEMDLNEKIRKLNETHLSTIATLKLEHDTTVTRLGDEAKKWRTRASDPSFLAQKLDLEGLRSLVDERTRVLQEVMKQNEINANELKEARQLVVELQLQADEYAKEKEAAEAAAEQAQRKRAELEDTMNMSLHSELLLRGEVQAELNSLKLSLAEKRQGGKDLASLEKENSILRDKIERQEQYMKKKQKQERVLRERLGNLGAKAPL